MIALFLDVKGHFIEEEAKGFRRPSNCANIYLILYI
jgi:hypothetical protein